MSLTPEQRALRRKGLGASEIAAVAGIHPYIKPLDVYLEKIGLREDEENRFQEWGQRLEGVIGRAWAERNPDRLITPGTTLVHPHEPWMMATPDFLSHPANELTGAGLECKARGMYDAHRWGESGSDQVPDEVAAQCHWGMMVTGLPRWDVAVLLGGNDFRSYTLRFDEGIAVSLKKLGHDFWVNHVLAETPPAFTPETARAAQQFVRRIFPHHDDAMIEATEEHDHLAYGLRKARAEYKEAEAVKQMWEARVKAVIGEHAGIMGSDYKITWKEAKGSRKTDWKLVAQSLLKIVPESARQLAMQLYTQDVPGSRRFLPTFPGEKDDE